MKIVCATLNSQFIHSSLAPWCLKAGVDAFCSKAHSIRILEGTINGDLSEFVNNIIKEKPDIIAFSCYIWNINKIIEACDIINQSIKCKICLGGPEAAYKAKEILEEYSFIDYVLSGEGEWTFSSLIENLCSDTSLNTSDGISFINNGAFTEIPAKCHKETPPSPYCDDYFLSLNGRIAYIEASRGCPYNCTYCLSGTLSGFRTFDFDSVTENIIRLSHSGTKTVKFIDRTFNADKIFCCRILEFILNNYGSKIKIGVCFHFEISAEIIDDNFINIIKKLPSGLCQFEIGIQSYNEKTLLSIKRNSNLSLLEKNISRLISLNNSHIHIDLIAGLPYENLQSFIYGFNKAFKLNAHMLQLGFLKVLYGSELRNNISEFGCKFSSQPPYEILSTHTLSQDEIRTLKLCEKSVDKLYNSGRFLYTIDYLIYSVNITPFELMTEAGKLLSDSNMCLTDTVAKIYNHFASECDSLILREKLLCDLAVSGVNIKIPPELNCYDKRYKFIKKKVTELFKANTKIVILNSQNKILTVPENSKKDLSGRFIPIIIDTDDILA